MYVKFPVKDDLGKLAQYGDLSKTYFLIWTTTIWTLPGNMAIAVHPRESYVLVKADNGEQYILAEALTEKVMKAGGIEHYEIAARFVGSDFEYMKARQPLPGQGLPAVLRRVRHHGLRYRLRPHRPRLRRRRL